jgi:Domain of unknown function (DUF4440)
MRELREIGWSGGLDKILGALDGKAHLSAHDIRNLHLSFWMAGAFGGWYGLASERAPLRVCARKCKAMIKTIFCCLLLTVGAFGQTAHERDDPELAKLVALEHLWNEAQVNRDERALEGMIADTFSNTEWDGEVSQRGKFLADIKDPKFKPDLVTIQDVKVNLYHNTGVVTGSYHTKGSYNGKPYDHVGRFTDTWVLEDGKWECVASHTSLLKK